MTKIIQRYDTAENWTSVNPVLAAGEMGVEYETVTTTFTLSDSVTTHGSPTYSNGIASNFSQSNYYSMNIPQIEEFDIQFTTGTNVHYGQYITAHYPGLNIEEGYLRIWLDDFTRIMSLSSSTQYNIKIINYDSKIEIYSNSVLIATYNQTLPTSKNDTKFGVSLDNYPFLGSIDFRNTSVNGQPITTRTETVSGATKFKLGDGTTAWSGLAYAAGEGGSGTTITSADGATTYSELALGDTLAVMDGTLNANLDELGNEVNTLASTVSANEADITELKNGKQDKLTAISPILIKTAGDLIADLEVSGTIINNGNGSYSNPISTAGKTNWVRVTPALDCIYTSDWEIIIPFRWDQNSGQASQTLIGGNSSTFYANIENNNLRVWYNYSSGIETGFLPSIGVKTWMRLRYTGGILTISFSTDGNTYSNTTSNSRSTLTSHTETYFFGGAQSWQENIGGGIFTIFFNEVKVYKGGNLQLDGIPAYSENYKTISVNQATTSSLGVVQPDGTSITVSDTGIISGQDVKTFTGYSDTGTLVLKSIDGVLQWVAEG